MNDAKIPIMLPAVARAQYPALWEVVSDYLPTLTEDQTAKVVSIVIHTAQIASQVARQDERVQMTERKYHA